MWAVDALLLEVLLLNWELVQHNNIRVPQFSSYEPLNIAGSHLIKFEYGGFFLPLFMLYCGGKVV